MSDYGSDFDVNATLLSHVNDRHQWRKSLSIAPRASFGHVLRRILMRSNVDPNSEQKALKATERSLIAVITIAYHEDFMPTLRQFEIFLEAAKDANFRKTADRLGISQPAISSQIKLLEKELGYQVFKRLRGRTPSLTAEALSLIPMVRQVVATSRSIVSDANFEGSLRKLHLTLYTRYFLFEQELMSALSDFLSGNDEIELDIKISEKTADIVQALQAGVCDIGLYRGSIPPTGVERVEFLSPSTMSIYASTAIAQEFRATGGAIEDLPFVLPREDQEANAFLLQILKDDRLEPKRVVARSQFPKTLAKWVINDRGVSPLFDHHMRQHVNEATVEPIARLSYSINTIMGLSQRALGKQAASLLEVIRDAVGR